MSGDGERKLDNTRIRYALSCAIALATLVLAPATIEASDCQDVCLAACPKHSGTFGTPEIDKACALQCLQKDCTQDASAPHAQPAATVEDRGVRQWIERGFAANGCGSPAAKEHDLNKADDPASLRAAWIYLKRCRDAGNSLNLNLAAAENYLFIRYASSLSGDTGYESTPKWYYTLKVAASKAGFSDYLRTSSQPVSEPSKDVLTWGNLGYRDGIRDYEKRTGTKATLKSAALHTVLSFLADQYYP